MRDPNADLVTLAAAMLSNPKFGDTNPVNIARMAAEVYGELQHKQLDAVKKMAIEADRLAKEQTALGNSHTLKKNPEEDDMSDIDFNYAP